MMTWKREERGVGAGWFEVVRWSVAHVAAMGSVRLWVDVTGDGGGDMGRDRVGLEEGREARRLVVVAAAGIACGGGDLAGKG